MHFNNVQFMRGQNDPLYGPNEGETSDVNNRGDWRRDPREVRAGEKEEIVRSARRRRCRWGIRPGRRSSGVCNQRRATGPCTRWASAPPTEGTAAAVAIPTTSCEPAGTAPGRPSCTPRKRRDPTEKTTCVPHFQKIQASIDTMTGTQIGYVQHYLDSRSFFTSEAWQIKSSWYSPPNRPLQMASKFRGLHRAMKWGLKKIFINESSNIHQS